MPEPAVEGEKELDCGYEDAIESDGKEGDGMPVAEYVAKESNRHETRIHGR